VKTEVSMMTKDGWEERQEQYTPMAYSWQGADRARVA